MSSVAGAPEVVLSVRDLRTHFLTRDGAVRAVDGLSFDVKRGETLCIVGESGCGKSVSALSIMRLIPESAGRSIAGSVQLEGTELTALSERQMRAIRGNRISMIFQEPMTSLNPVLTVGEQIAESARIHQRLHPRAALERAVEMLSIVKIADPGRRACSRNQKQDRPPGPLGSRQVSQHPRNLDHRRDPGRVVQSAVVDRVAGLVGRADSQMIPVRRKNHVLIFQLGIAAGKNSRNVGRLDPFHFAVQFERAGQVQLHWFEVSGRRLLSQLIQILSGELHYPPG